jgi:hypothetical protein
MCPLTGTFLYRPFALPCCGNSISRDVRRSDRVSRRSGSVSHSYAAGRRRGKARFVTECPSSLQALVQHLHARRKCPVCNRQLHLPAKPEDLPVNVTVQRAMARMLGHEIQVRCAGKGFTGLGGGLSEGSGARVSTPGVSHQAKLPEFAPLTSCGHALMAGPLLGLSRRTWRPKKWRESARRPVISGACSRTSRSFQRALKSSGTWNASPACRPRTSPVPNID